MKSTIFLLLAFFAVGTQAILISLPMCLAACRGTPAAFEAFCRTVPHPAARAVLWPLALGLKTPVGQTLCVNTCNGVFPA
jgi:hypothetical protein